MPTKHACLSSHLSFPPLNWCVSGCVLVGPKPACVAAFILKEFLWMEKIFLKMGKVSRSRLCFIKKNKTTPDNFQNVSRMTKRRKRQRPGYRPQSRTSSKNPTEGLSKFITSSSSSRSSDSMALVPNIINL